MKITFVQNDIIAALKSHIVSQGINLDGKSVDIKFTMKKGNAGVEADVTIENAPAIPDLIGTTDAAAPQRPALSVVASNPAPAATVETPAAVPAVVETPVTEVGGSSSAPEATKTTSLFG